MKTAVAFIIFNRIDTTTKVFEKIREAKPDKLYIISDGARESVEGEAEKVSAVRDYVESNIDWECSVYKNYSEKNVGCGKRIVTGLDWVFEHEETAIILEDDCLPDETFFEYCDQMLDYYQDNDKIMLISGNNPIESKCNISETYSFCKIPFIWGWATWRRAWKKFDFSISSWKHERKNPVWKEVFPRKAYCYYTSQFDVLYKQKFNVWDYQMVYAVILNNMLCVIPAKSHVRNLGFGGDATNTTDVAPWVEFNLSPVEFPIVHPKQVEWNRDIDESYLNEACWNGYIVWIKKHLGLDINKKYF